MGLQDRDYYREKIARLNNQEDDSDRDSKPFFNLMAKSRQMTKAVAAVVLLAMILGMILG